MEKNKFDSNAIIGFVLLFVMYGIYFYFNSQNPPPAETTDAATTQTVQPAKAATATPTPADTAQLKQQFGTFSDFMLGDSRPVVIENDYATYTFSTKGGALESVVLKEYTPYNEFIRGEKVPLELIDADNSEMDLVVNTNSGPLNLKNLYFSTDAADKKVVSSGDSTVVTFRLPISDSQAITQSYTIHGNSYIVDYDIEMKNVESLLSNRTVTFTWKDDLKQLENDMNENRKAAQINYYDDEEDFDDVGDNSLSNDSEKVDGNIKWFSFKQKYFVSGIVAENTNAFENTDFELVVPESDSGIVKTVTATTHLRYDELANGKGNFRFYFGPNNVDLVSRVAPGFEKNVYLGYDIVKPINRYVFVPLFEWVSSFVSNYGLLIIIVVLLIKTLLTPLIYTSYTSSAKMRVLAPEINAIKERVGDDQMKVQQETMDLYRQVGVSPLSGCVPMLLQMPILMSVFFLFPNMIMFRQEGFLWAKDLSTYDAPIRWATNLPIIGNHISLFVVLMTISSLAFTYYNNQITPDQNTGPIDMKKISYVFPIVFFFVLNNFPAALSFYYLVSNLVTIAQQLLVRQFIDEDKIRLVLENNRKTFKDKPKKKSKFSEMMERQLKLQEEANREKAAQLAKQRNKRK